MSYHKNLLAIAFWCHSNWSNSFFLVSFAPKLLHKMHTAAHCHFQPERGREIERELPADGINFNFSSFNYNEISAIESKNIKVYIITANTHFWHSHIWYASSGFSSGNVNAEKNGTEYSRHWLECPSQTFIEQSMPGNGKRKFHTLFLIWWRFILLHIRCVCVCV